MTPPVPLNQPSSLADTTDFEKYEDFILEEYMDMTYEDNEQAKSSGPVHPSHYSGISSEDKSLFIQNFGTNSETERLRQQKHEREVFDRHDSHQGPILTTLNTSGTNNPANSPPSMKTVHASLNEETSKMPQKDNDYPNLFNPEECGRFEMMNQANNEQRTLEIPATSELKCNQEFPSQSVLHRIKMVDTEQEGYSEGNRGSSDEVRAPEMTDIADSRHLSSKGWNQAQTIDLRASLDALPHFLAHEIQPNKRENPYVVSQNAHTLKPLTVDNHSYPLDTEEMTFIRFDDTISDTLVIDEWPKEDDQRPSVIVPSPSAPIEGLQHRTDIRTTDPEIPGEEFQLHKEWSATSSCYPGQQFANCTPAIPWGFENEIYGLKNAIPSMNNAPWDYHPIHEIQPNKPKNPYVACQNAHTLKPLSVGSHSYLLGTEEMISIRSDDTISDTLFIDEWPKEDEQRPSVIVQSPSAPIEGLQHRADITTIDPEIPGEEFQLHQEWPATSSNHLSTSDDGVQPHANRIDQYNDSSSGVVDPILNQNPEQIAEYTVGPLTHTRDVMWSQPNNYFTTMAGRNIGGFYDDHAIQRLAANFARLNQPTDPERPMTSNDTAFEALASMGLFPYPCNDPSCPGDISRQFQEFPFPRRKSTSRGLSYYDPNQINPMLSSSGSGSECILSEMFEVEPNQEEHRLLLRRMRNREAAKRCRKKKKHEFIALLFKRAMLLAEYHRCYHTACHQNIPKT